MSQNLLAQITAQSTGPFRWANPSSYICLPEGGIRITAPARTDYFRDPDGSMVADSAPYLYLDVSGDFVLKARVRHPFRFVYDSTTLMVRKDAEHWGKLCFEGSDFGTHAIVSVVTNGVSDDANGVNYTWPEVWLQIVRKGGVFGLHYGPDGEHWNMTRYFGLPVGPTIQVGMVAQCPLGEGSEMDFLHFSIDAVSVKDVRAGK